jgi:glycosyltransferase involved in cell wall biosynthesis
VKVSALIPTYNRRNYVCRAIESVLAQSLPVDEIVVIDDGSTDGTLECLRQRYAHRVRVCSQRNQGVGVARRRAVEKASGDWVAFLDSDDEWLPERNAAFVRAAYAAPENVAWIFGDTLFVTDDHPSGISIFREHGLHVPPEGELLPRNFVGPAWNPARPACSLIQSAFIKRSALVALDCFREGLRHTEDFVAAAQVGTRYAFFAIPDVVTRLYRTFDLEQSSLELGNLGSLDQYQARLLGSALAAKVAGRDPWGKIHEEMVRAICKIRAEENMPFRLMAFQQFRFGISMKSLVFTAAALCGPSMIRAGLATKQKMREMRSSSGY